MLTGLGERYRQRAVVGLAVKDIELTLELFDLGLKGVELALHGQNVADRRGSGQDRQVLLAARLERGDPCLEIDVLTRDISGCRGN